MYIHTIDTNTTLRFMGWVALTYTWLSTNCFFFTAIADAIDQHNEQIRLKAIEELNEYKDESESEDESEDEGE